MLKTIRYISIIFQTLLLYLCWLKIWLGCKAFQEDIASGLGWALFVEGILVLIVMCIIIFFHNILIEDFCQVDPEDRITIKKSSRRKYREVKKRYINSKYGLCSSNVVKNECFENFNSKMYWCKTCKVKEICKHMTGLRKVKEYYEKKLDRGKKR